MAAPTKNAVSTRLLLGVVVGLGLLLLLGLGLVVGVIVLRLAESSPAAPMTQSFSAPPGMKVQSVTPSSRYAIIHLAPANGASGEEWLLWFDAEGRERARLRLTPQP